MKELAGEIQTPMAGIGTKDWELVVKDLFVCDCFQQQQRWHDLQPEEYSISTKMFMLARISS